MYHDLYILNFLFINKITINWPRINNVIFSYKRNKKRIHTINDISLLHKEDTNDALLDMFSCLFNNQVNFEYNQKITLKTNEIIDKILKVLTNEQKNSYK